MPGRITIIGAALMDVLARPVDFSRIASGSQPMEGVRLSYGGDALNEAVVLTRLGQPVELISKVGEDEAGAQILGYLKREGIGVRGVVREKGLATSVNIVLVDAEGERYFLTDANASLRKLSEQDVMQELERQEREAQENPAAPEDREEQEDRQSREGLQNREDCAGKEGAFRRELAGEIVSFASMFVSPQMDIPAMERIFRRIRKSGRILAADMTKAKKGEKLRDLEPVLPWLDYIFPNHDEIALLTGDQDPERNARRLVEGGVSCAVVKCGREGCLICTREKLWRIPACPVSRVADTTGAGDCFAAGFLYGVSQGLSLPECGCFANAVASCTVEELGATQGVRSLEEPMRRFRMLKERVGA